MKKQTYWIHFRDGYDVDAVDEIVWDFAEANHYYEDNEVRFCGTPERLEEFKRAISSVEIIEKIV